MVLMMFRHSEAPRHGSGAEPDADGIDSLARQAAISASRGHYRKALAYYGRALLLDDSRAVLWFNYANVQRHLGLLQDAVLSFEFALRIDPRLFAARYSLANLLFELGQPLAAMGHYQEVLARNPDYVPAWRNLGRLRCAMGEFAEGEGCLREAIRRAPQDAELVGLLEEILLQRRAAAEN